MTLSNQPRNGAFESDTGHRIALGHRSLMLAVYLLALIGSGCTIVPIYKYPNDIYVGEPEEPVGTYNASLNIPWNYDFTKVSEPVAAACRRSLALRDSQTELRTGPCALVPKDENFVALALSGGGSRSAAFSSAIMWELKAAGILEHVDVISAVSGGAQAAAVYALTRDPADADPAFPERERYVVDPDDPYQFVDIFATNLTLDWLVSLIMPWHLAAYWVTYFDRTDVMVDSLSDRYYPRGPWYQENWGMRFRDINPKRPNLLMNAVDMTLRRDEDNVPLSIAGECFVQSYETFRHGLGSDLHDLPIAFSVMASSAYPGIYHYLTVRDFDRATPKGGNAYVHLSDGAVRDQLALVPINAMLRTFAEGRPLSDLQPHHIARACEFSRGAGALAQDVLTMEFTNREGDGARRPPAVPKKILVIVIDGGKPPLGFPENDADPRATFFDYVVPVRKVIDVVDTILDDQRALRAAELLELRNHLTGTKSVDNLARKCLEEHRQTGSDIAECLSTSPAPTSDPETGVFGATCCPIIGMGIHDFTKFASSRFGPFNKTQLNSEEVWGADHITVECLEDNDFGRGEPNSHYASIRQMATSLSINSREIETIKSAAQLVVDEMLADFCDRDSGRLAGVAGIACTPPTEQRLVGCRR